jgi:hypothetical protein
MCRRYTRIIFPAITASRRFPVEETDLSPELDAARRAQIDRIVEGVIVVRRHGGSTQWGGWESRQESLRGATPKAVPLPKILFHSPVEAGPIAPEIMQWLPGLLRYVVFTEYGRREIEAAKIASTGKRWRKPRTETRPVPN